MSDVIRIMLVDDHAVVRAGLSRLVEQQNNLVVVSEYSRGEDAYRYFDSDAIDIVVMDLSMTGIGGMEASRKIMGRYPHAKIIIFSMHENPTYAAQLIKIGVKGYVTKTGEDDDLIKAIYTVAQGKSYLNAELAQKIAMDISVDENPIKQLSTREFEIFRLTAEGLAPEEIGQRLNISQKTVSNYSTLIKQKLNINTPVEILRLAMRYGIIEK